MAHYCATQGCQNLVGNFNCYCSACQPDDFMGVHVSKNLVVSEVGPPELVAKYPKYYKDVSKLSAIDVYGVCGLFGVEDPSGALHHSIKKLLLSGVRTGGKSKQKDITEARDTLNRWLELNPEITP